MRLPPRPGVLHSIGLANGVGLALAVGDEVLQHGAGVALDQEFWNGAFRGVAGGASGPTSGHHSGGW
jgi:hypothetical protein